MYFEQKGSRTDIWDGESGIGRNVTDIPKVGPRMMERVG